LPQALNVAEALAKLHVYSWTSPIWKDVPLFRKDARRRLKWFVDTYETVIPQVFEQYKHLLTSITSSAQVLELDGLNATFEWEDKNLHISNKCPVLVHGDLWTNNIMWQFDPLTPGSRGQLVAFVDWQTTRVGCCMEDLAAFLISSCSTELRREHEIDILKHYHQSICKFMTSSPPPYAKFEQIVALYYQCARLNCMTLFYWLPAIEAALAPVQKAETAEKIVKRFEAAIVDTLAHEFPNSKIDL